MLDSQTLPGTPLSSVARCLFVHILNFFLSDLIRDDVVKDRNPSSANVFDLGSLPFKKMDV